MKWYQKEVTWGILIKLMVCINLVVLAMCWRISNIRTTQDEETLEHINYLEETLDREKEYRNVLWDYVNYLKEN